MAPAVDEPGAAPSVSVDLLTALAPILPLELQFVRRAPDLDGRRAWFRCRFCDATYVGGFGSEWKAAREQPAAWVHEAFCPARTDPLSDAEIREVWEVFGPLVHRLADVIHLIPSRIGATQFFTRSLETDSVSFYQGVSFALARIRGILAKGRNV